MPVDFVALLKQLQGACKVYLVLVEASWQRGVAKAALDSENVPVPKPWIIDILLEILEQLLERHLVGHAAHIVVEGWLEQEGELVRVLRLLEHHVDAP